MNPLDFFKKYSFTLLTAIIVIGVGLVLWRLYDQVYAPLFIRPIETTTSEATQYRVPETAVTQALEQLQAKQTPISFETVTTELTPLPVSTTTTPQTQAQTEGITIDQTAP